MSNADEVDAEEEFEIPPPKRPAGNTLFNFSHKIFDIRGAHFAYGDDGVTPSFFVPLGGVIASIPVVRVCFEFRINHGTKDFELVGIVSRALEYVREIRPGDSIPSELLDGSASWTFEPEHALAARVRLFGEVANWLSDKPQGGQAGWALRRAVEAQQDTLAEAATAMELLADGIGLTNDAFETHHRCELVAREFAYIEALRAHYVQLAHLPTILDRFRRLAAKDRNRREEYDRMGALIETPIDNAQREFKRVDDLLNPKTKTLVHSLKEPEQTIMQVRTVRDRLHSDAMVWQPIANLWGEDDIIEDDARRIATYRYLASNFAQGVGMKMVLRHR